VSETKYDGWFITFEGPDGCGKTTQVKLLAAHLGKQSYDVLQTREPGGTDISDQIRHVVHNLENTTMHPRTEALLYAASRAQHVEQVIRPHLMRGGLVLCDRYADSSLAYQGYGHQLDLEMIHQLVAIATGDLKPNLTLYFDIDPQEGLRRREAAVREGAEWNRLDDYALDFHRRVREGYQKLIAQEPERWVVLDAAKPVEEVQEAARREVMARLAVGKT
jgi:dTMP kinase